MKSVVIVPTYNELDNVDALLTELLALPVDLSVIVVDDNSPDGTGDLLRGIAELTERVRVIHRPGKSGLGTAYMDGMTFALADGADYVVQNDVSTLGDDAGHRFVIHARDGEDRQHCTGRRALADALAALLESKDRGCHA